ncbi:MAG: ABC transporter substrate-binding protein, partial [Oceanospirillales bacterium]|nr:ABC transporter substrate-binding protein [Oceanospirillales bacterium]
MDLRRPPGERVPTRVRYCFSCLLIFFSALVFADDSQDTPLESVRLQLKWFHSFQFAGYYMAKEKGFYEEAGLDVELIERDPKLNNIRQVIEGTADYGVADSSLLLYRAEGNPVRVMASIFQHSPLVFITRGSSDNIGPESLAGKRLSYQKGLDEAPLLSML